LITDSDAYYTHTVDVGAVDISPDAIHTSSGTVYAHTLGGLYALTAPLYTSDTFATYTILTGQDSRVQVAWVDLRGVQGGFIGDVIAPDAVHVSTNIFYTPVVATIGDANLGPSLFTSTNIIPTHIVSSGVVLEQTTEHTNTNSFYVPIVAPGAVNLTPSLVTNAQTYYTQSISIQELRRVMALLYY
jgi:hypothetical protein